VPGTPPFELRYSPLHPETRLINKHRQRTTAGVAYGQTLLRGWGEGGSFLIFTLFNSQSSLKRFSFLICTFLISQLSFFIFHFSFLCFSFLVSGEVRFCGFLLLVGYYIWFLNSELITSAFLHKRTYRFSVSLQPNVPFFCYCLSQVSGTHICPSP